MEGEEPRRLPVLPGTARQLYLLSGNQCAFPGCTDPLIDENGHWVGQLCHIEGVLPGGERFNGDMTNEQRRAAANIILLCYRHHIATDDVDKYPPEVLWKMKSDHESRFRGAVDQIVQADVVDVTVQTPEHSPSESQAFARSHTGRSGTR